MVKVIKIIVGTISIIIGLSGLYLYFVMENIEFIIQNKTAGPISTYITIHSYDTSSDYTYPLLAKELIEPNQSKETFYTIDESYNGTECTRIFFKNEKGEEVKSYPCPKSGETLVVN